MSSFSDSLRFDMTTTKEAGRKRWRGVKKQEHLAVSSKGGASAWASMTPAERSAEMKRRAAKRKKKPRARRTKT
jgi:hypothetical protein